MADYITLEEANTYILANKLSTERSSWTTAEDSDKSIAITKATKAIDRLPFRGDKVSTSQENQFPRGTDTSAPQDILDACAELAFSFIDGRDAEFEFDNLIAYCEYTFSSGDGDLPVIVVKAKVKFSIHLNALGISLILNLFS